jgi:predicted transcriptional regulator
LNCRKTWTPEGLQRAAELLDKHFPAEQSFGAAGRSESEEDEYQLTPEDLASLKRGIADADAGRTLSIEESEAASKAALIARFNARMEK